MRDAGVESAENGNREKDPSSILRFDQLPFPSILASCAGEIIRANRSAAQVTGYSAGEVRGLSIVDLLEVPPSSGEESPLLETLSRSRIEILLHHKSGNTRRCLAHAVSVEEGWLVQLVDLHVLLQSKRALEEKCRAYIAHAPIGFAMIGPDGRFIEVNARLARSASLEPHEMIGTSPTDFFSPASAQAGLDHFRRLMEEGFATGEMLIRTANGQDRYYRVDGVRLEEGYAVVFVVDVHDQRVAEEQLADALNQLQASSDLYHAYLEYAPFGCVVHDGLGRFIETNHAHRRLFGYGEEYDVTQLNAADFISPQAMEAGMAFIQRLLECGEAEEDLFCRALDSGEDRMYRIRAVRISENRYITFGIDIEDRRVAEEKLREIASQLQQSNESLDEFAYMASHDLQEPLRMIASYVTLLQRRYAQQLDEDAQEFFRFAIDGAERMQRLIQSLLAYSRAQKREFSYSEVRAGDLVSEALENLQSAIGENGATISQEGDFAILLHADRVQMVQVLQNLLSNALKFRRSEPPCISIALIDHADHLEFQVSDNGIGIPPGVESQVFAPFKRLHAASEYPGTGIGLAMVKTIIERHGGSIEYERAMPYGVTFRFTVPKRAQGA